VKSGGKKRESHKKNSGFLNVILFVMVNFFGLRFTLMNFLICPKFFLIIA
jgi:hypothetical protein